VDPAFGSSRARCSAAPIQGNMALSRGGDRRRVSHDARTLDRGCHDEHPLAPDLPDCVSAV